MRKNERVDCFGMVHIVREGSYWHDGTGIIYGAVFHCDEYYRSSITRITRKLPANCLLCIRGASHR